MKNQRTQLNLSGPWKVEDIHSDRGKHPHDALQNMFYNLIDEDELERYEEHMTNEHTKKWHSAMQDKMHSLHENYTYDLVELLEGQRAEKQMGLQAEKWGRW